MSKRTSDRKHLFTVRALDDTGEHICHKEHIVGQAGVTAYLAETVATSDTHIAYVRIFNETTGNTRYQGFSQRDWPAGHAKETRQKVEEI